jgi:hypothetical protein
VGTGVEVAVWAEALAGAGAELAAAAELAVRAETPGWDDELLAGTGALAVGAELLAGG